MSLTWNALYHTICAYINVELFVNKCQKYTEVEYYWSWFLFVKNIDKIGHNNLNDYTTISFLLSL